MLKQRRILSLMLSILVCVSMCGLSFSTVIVSADEGNLLVAAGQAFSLAVDDSGDVWGWGDNSYGQLGTQGGGALPILINGISDVTQINAGLTHVLAIKTDGTVWAWGRNNYGQLGNGNTSNQSTPVKVKTVDGNDLTDVIQVAAGDDFSLALKSDGTVWAWGSNTNGRLGNGTKTASSLAVQTSITDVTQIAAGSKHGMALKSDGTVWAWGNNSYGQLGQGNTSEKTTPTQVLNLQNITQIAVGLNHNLALQNDSSIWGWGRNDNGQLGDGTYSLRTVLPKEVHSGERIFAGGNVSFYQDAEGVWGSGYNYYGQLGGTNIYDAKVATPIKCALEDIASMSISTTHVLAVDSSKYIWGWGANDSDQLDARGTKTGLSRKLKISFNDRIGATSETAADLNLNEENINSSIEFVGDHDVYKFTATSSGYWGFIISGIYPINIQIYTNNASCYTSSGKLAQSLIPIVAGTEYYIDISGASVNDYTINQKILAQAQVIDASVTYANGSVSASGTTYAGADKSIIMRLYAPDGDLADIQSVNSNSNGQFSLSANIDTSVAGTYQVLISGQNTQNVEYATFTVGEASDIQPINTGFGSGSNLTAGNVTINNSNYTATVSISNSSSFEAQAGLAIIGKDSNGNLTYAQAKSSTIAPGKEKSIPVKVSDIDVVDGTFYAVIYEGDSYYSGTFIPVKGIETLTGLATLSVPIDYSSDPEAIRLAALVDEQFEQEQQQRAAGISLMADDNETVDGIVTTPPTQPYASTFVKYNDTYCEGVIQDGTLYLESWITNPTNSPVSISIHFQVSKEENILVYYDNYTERVEAQSDAIITIEREMSEFVNNPEIASVRFNIWTASMSPLSPVVQLTNGEGIDLYFSEGTAYAPMVSSDGLITGKINTEGDRDILKFSPFYGGVMFMDTDPIFDDGIQVLVRDSNFQNPVSAAPGLLPVTAGETYYLDITGTVGTEYQFMLEFLDF